MKTDDVKKFGKAIANSDGETDITYKAIAAMAFLTGMRQSELIGLKKCNVDFENGTVAIVSQLLDMKDGTFPETPQSTEYCGH